MKADKFPLTVTEKGVTAVIRKADKLKKGRKLNYFIVEYLLRGKRKQVWRSDLGVAKAVAREACIKISNGDFQALELRNGELLAYTRAVEILSPVHVPIDSACREFVDARAILGGKASISEACRDWVKRNAVALPKITVTEAGNQLQRQAAIDRKSEARQKQLRVVVDRMADNFNVQVHTITPSQISAYLAGLPMAERSKRNHRDVIGFFNRWLVLRGFLPKGTDWLEGVQNYTARKLGEIEIYTPDELKSLLNKAHKQFVPFLALGAFAGLRHAEIARLDWQEIDLEDGWIEIRADKAKTQTRRLVPIKPNLKAWLTPYSKLTGKVCPFQNTLKQLFRAASRAGLKWKRNALRHSAISYRIAECSDIPRVADESGNSVQIIRTNYLRRVKPAVAAEWFSIMPPTKKVSRKLVT
jgi:integrase